MNLQAVIAATREVGDMAMSRWRGEGRTVQVWDKSPNNPVSDVDLAVDERLKAVRWGLATNIVWAWVLTIPASAAVGWFSMECIQLFVTGN